jgi:hypothetical protein
VALPVSCGKRPVQKSKIEVSREMRGNFESAKKMDSDQQPNQAARHASVGEVTKLRVRRSSIVQTVRGARPRVVLVETRVRRARKTISVD